MKRIIKSRLDEHMIDLYNRVDNLKKDISIIKNNHLKHMSCAIYKIEKKVDKQQYSSLFPEDVLGQAIANKQIVG